LPDGSQVCVVRPPAAVGGPYLSIRRFGANPLKLEDLLNYKAFTPEMALVLEAALQARLNVLISGGTGSGKTTLLNTLSSLLPAGRVAVTVEEEPELQLQMDNVVRLQADPDPASGAGLGTLLRRAAELHPDVIVLGEVRGPEAWDLLEVMDSGPHQTLATVHAEDPADALARLEWLAQSAHELPASVLRRLFVSGVDLIVQANRLQGGPRKLTAICEPVGIENGEVVLRDLFRFRQGGIDQNGRAWGQFEATGAMPTFLPRLEAVGIHLPAVEALFAERVLLRD
jgi:pilus assembly protein CpaF